MSPDNGAEGGGDMHLRLLGRSGLRVSELCLGTMTFGTGWGWGAEEDVCREIYDAFREAGGNFVDTANTYTNGGSEEIVGRLVASERDQIVLATKFTLPADRTEPNSGGSHRKSLRRNVETSLRRLGTDYVDLLWVHVWDECTPVEETLRALDDLVRAGKVLAIGVSNQPAWVISRADAIAELRGWTTYTGLQTEYSLMQRTGDRELIPMARELGIAVTAWSPLAGGLLTGKFSGGDAATADSLRGGGSRVITPAHQRVIDETVAVAGEVGCTPAEVALAWVLRHDMIPVLGARTPAQIRDNLGVLDVQLDDAQLARLDAVSVVEMGSPHEFVASRRSVVSGGILEG